MEFGYGLVTAQRPPEGSDDYKTVYEDAIHLAQVAEESGFDTVWTSEHHGFPDGYMPSVLPMCAALARETESVDIGSGVALAPLYQPLRLAEDAATVDLLSDGRFTLGLANGYVPHEFDAFDVPMSERAPRVEDVIEICRRSWTGEPIDYDGNTVEIGDLSVQPVVRPPRPRRRSCSAAWPRRPYDGLDAWRTATWPSSTTVTTTAGRSPSNSSGATSN